MSGIAAIVTKPARTYRGARVPHFSLGAREKWAVAFPVDFETGRGTTSVVAKSLPTTRGFSR